jgi:hypothetical protein
VRSSVDEVFAGADVFIGVAAPGVVTPAGIARMAPDAIVFALANRTPEILPEEIDGLVAVAVVATGPGRTIRTRSTTPAPGSVFAPIALGISPLPDVSPLR